MIIYQCDTAEKNKEVLTIFEEFVSEYLDQSIKANLDCVQGPDLLVALGKNWDSFNIYSKMMDKSFEYLNRYYLKNNSLELVGEKCMSMFKRQIFREVEKNIT